MANTLRLLPPLPKKKSDPDETPTAPSIPRTRTIEEERPPDRDLDAILVSYILDLDRVV